MTSVLIDSIMLGSLYTLMALGITMIYSVTKVANFAQGDLMTVGSYGTILAIVIFKMNLLVAAAMSFAISGGLSLGLAQFLYMPLARRETSRFMLFVATVAVSLIIRNTIYAIIVRPQMYWALMTTTGISPQIIITIGGYELTDFFFEAVFSTFALILVLQLILRKSKFGKSMRAVRDNLELARSTGIDVEHVQKVTWTIAGGLAGIAGFFWALYLAASPLAGSVVLWRAFAASVIGGLNSFPGTIVGGYVIGIGENYVSDWLYHTIAFPLAMKPVLIYGLLFIVMMFVPNGVSAIPFSRIKARVKAAVLGRDGNLRR